MKVQFYLIVGSNKSVRTVKTKPNLNWDEVAILTTLELPDVLFQKPTLTANIVVPNDAALPVKIPTDVADNIRESIESITGMDVNITISNPEL